MARMKKAVAKKSANAKPADALKAKWRAAVKQAAQLKKELNQKLKVKTAEFKKKLKEVEQEAMHKAAAMLERELAKKEQAKKKILAAAEQKFEKRFSKKSGKPAVKKTAKKALSKTKAVKNKIKAKVKPAAAKKSSKRGRTAKKAAVQQHDATA